MFYESSHHGVKHFTGGMDKRLTNYYCQFVLAMILCGEFVGVCNTMGFVESSNKLVHCIGKTRIPNPVPDIAG